MFYEHVEKNSIALVLNNNEQCYRHFCTGFEHFSPPATGGAASVYTELSSGLGNSGVCFLFSRILFSSSAKE